MCILGQLSDDFLYGGYGKNSLSGGPGSDFFEPSMPNQSTLYENVFVDMDPLVDWTISQLPPSPPTPPSLPPSLPHTDQNMVGLYLFSPVLPFLSSLVSLFVGGRGRSSQHL